MEIEDLKKLREEIWEHIPRNPCSHNIYERMGRSYENRERKITDEEWDECAEERKRRAQALATSVLEQFEE